MASIQFAKLAQAIAKKESGKEEVNIAQINEILKITLEVLAQYPILDISKLLDNYK
jgi:hypothetical protein